MTLTNVFPDSHDDIRLEARRQLYKATVEAKDGTPTFQAPPFTAVISYVLERVDSLPKKKWYDVANQPVPFSLPVMEQVRFYTQNIFLVIFIVLLT